MINVGLINMRLYLLIIFYRVYGHQNVSESCSILQFFTCLSVAAEHSIKPMHRS